MDRKPEYDKKLLDLLSDIKGYIDFLKREYDLTITVHQLDTYLNSFMSHFKTINHHMFPYCLRLKQNGELWQSECIRRQKCLFASALDEPFFGTCWAGVGEFVFPVANPHSGDHAFVSVSGYRGDEPKSSAQMRKISEKYGIPLAEMQRLHDDLRAERPTLAELKPLIIPLTYMLTLLLMYLHDMNARFPQRDSGAPNLFGWVCQDLRYHYNIDFSLEELAKRHNCSVSHLSHLFRKYADCSYREYVNNMKTELAKVYLVSTNMPVQEISDLLGYSNSNYFSTVFKRVCGIPPREYREKHKKSPAPLSGKKV